MKTRMGWTESPINDPIFNFVCKPLSSGIDFNELNSTPFVQMAHHLQKHKELSRKSNLFFNMQEFAEVFYINIK